MTTETDRPVFPGLIPEPRDIQMLGDMTELSEDVRLVTSNVLPLQRKAMRGILTAAGVRVVANKKKFVIEVSVEDIEKLDVDDVPESARDEFYELRLDGNRVFIRTPTQAGALWGVQTLSGIYRAEAMGEPIPNVLIRDWPDLPRRGLFIENKWGPDRMDLTDWCSAIDRAASLKMNVVGVGLYGCWGSCRYEGAPTEFLMVPVPDHPELQTPKSLRWYSSADEEWHDKKYLPEMFETDFFADVVAYGREKGVYIVPFVNSLGHNTLIPRALPDVSAKENDGTAKGVGYCLSSDKTRHFLESFYGSIIERYYPQGIDYFHVQMDEVWPDYPDPEDPHRRVDPWCECTDCSSVSREEKLTEYILWLVGMLAGKGVGKVVLWNDQLTRHMDVLNAGLTDKLKEAGLLDRVILHWWWYSNDGIDDSVHVKKGTDLGLEGWVAPMTCYFNWERYSVTRDNIALMLEMASVEGATGAVSYAVHDPAWTDHEALLADYAWNTADHAPVTVAQDQWISGRYGANAGVFKDALGALEKAAGEFPAIRACYNYRYTYCTEKPPFPPDYPGAALRKLTELEDAAGQLQSVRDLARAAAAGFAQIAALEESYLSPTDLACARSLLGEAARLEGLAEVFAALLPLWTAAQSGSVPGDSVALCSAARDSLLKAMQTLEENKPDWVVPACLHALSLLLAYLDQAQVELGEAAEGKRSVADISWHFERPPVPETSEEEEQPVD